LLGRLASAGDDGAIRLWGQTSWACEVTVHHTAAAANVPEDMLHEEEQEDDEEEEETASVVGVLSLEVFEESLISGGDDSVIRIWNTNTWICEWLLRAHQDEVWSIRMLRSDACLVTGSVDGTIRIWRYQRPNHSSTISHDHHSSSSSNNSSPNQLPMVQRYSNNRNSGCSSNIRSPQDHITSSSGLILSDESEKEWICEQTIQTDNPVYSLCCLEGSFIFKFVDI
jgi:WD40 repeat protein